ncbi:MAG: APC family permease [Firmicutes bacterium]|nr:APC family permease [Bacillota bacterium]
MNSQTNVLKEKYGLFTAIAMVAGIVVGSGVFFKSADILAATGGNMWLSILAWAIGGLVMFICAFTFCTIAKVHPQEPGFVGYTDKLVGRTYSYCVGWFLATIYIPCMASILCWISALYTVLLFGLPQDAVWALAGGYMVLIFAINTLAPKIAGKIQVSTLAIKLVPLVLMAIIGTIVGLANGTTVSNFGTTSIPLLGKPNFFAALLGALFAYDGWIVITSIVPEIKNAKRNLPLALIIGSVIIIGIYLIYFVGLTSTMHTNDFLSGDNTEIVKQAFSKIFSKVGGTLLFVFVIISCLGGANGIMMSNTRGMHLLSQKNMTSKHAMFGKVCDTTNTPYNSSIVGLLVAMVWLIVWYFNMTYLQGKFDTATLSIVFMYALFIPMFFMAILKHKGQNPFVRFVLPIASILCSLLIMFAAIYSTRIYALWFLLIVLAVQGFGLLLLHLGKPKKQAPPIV